MTMLSSAVAEVVMTFMFLIVILGTTHHRAPVGFAGFAIGLALSGAATLAVVLWTERGRLFTPAPRLP